MEVGKSTRISALELKLERIKSGLKQYELAARVGIGPTQLSEIETGRREPSPQLLQRILKVLRVNDDVEKAGE